MPAELEPREALRLFGDGLCASNLARGRDRAEVGAQHHVGVEDRDQRLERPFPRRRKEGLGCLALPAEIEVGLGSSSLTRRRARLASWRVASGERSTTDAISSKGTANMSWRM
jgi:hypothetical protein